MKEQTSPFQVIIAHPIPAEQIRLASILERDGLFRVLLTTHSGLDCLRQTLDHRPALLVLDAVLEQMDGLEVLRRLQDVFPRPRCLLVTSYGAYVQGYAQCIGADYCLIAPYSDKALLDSARMLVQPPEAAFSDRDIDAATVRALGELDVPGRLKAYPYVEDAVRLLLRDPDLVRRRQVIQRLYRGVAANRAVSDRQVERNLRTLVRHVFDRCDPDRLAEFFGGSDLRQFHATNTDFLLALAGHVRADLEKARSGWTAVDRAG